MKGRFPEAITFYKKAIDNYPKTDRFHLNEAYNNIGTVYYELKKYKKAKESWEQALFLLPSDRMVKHNLHDCIYTNPSVPEKMREISPMVAKLFEKKIT
jgi:tetratricopeptide (TPR) repeat protein